MNREQVLAELHMTVEIVRLTTSGPEIVTQT
jgi:hypothetical protein